MTRTKRTLSTVGAAAAAFALSFGLAAPASAATVSATFSCDGGYGGGTGSITGVTVGGVRQILVTTTLNAPATIPAGIPVTLSTGSTIWNSTAKPVTVPSTPPAKVGFFNFTTATPPTTASVTTADTIKIITGVVGVGTITCNITSFVGTGLVY